MEHKELDDMVDRLIFKLNSVQSEAAIFFPRSKTLQLMYDLLISDWALIEELLQLILSHRYLQP